MERYLSPEEMNYALSHFNQLRSPKPKPKAATEKQKIESYKRLHEGRTPQVDYCRTHPELIEDIRRKMGEFWKYHRLT